MEAKKIHWCDMLGNPYRYGLEPRMLNPDGYLHKCAVRVKGQSKKDDPRPVIIHFDEEYVISYLVQYVFNKLQLRPKDYNSFQKIFAKAWKQYQENKKQGEQSLLDRCHNNENVDS